MHISENLRKHLIKQYKTVTQLIKLYLPLIFDELGDLTM